jgi:hypothetical protein
MPAAKMNSVLPSNRDLAGYGGGASRVFSIRTPQKVVSRVIACASAARPNFHYALVLTVGITFQLSHQFRQHYFRIPLHLAS